MAQQANQQAIERIKASRAKSLKLIQMDNNGSLNKIAESKRDSINNSINNDVQYTSTPSNNIQRTVNTNPIRSGGAMLGAGASNVPSVIRESFMKNPGADDASVLMSTMSGNGDLSELGELFMPEEKVERKQVVNEQQTIPQPAQIQNGYQSQIDYPMIRTIVEEIVRKYASSLNKKIINESKNDGGVLNTLSIGKTFKFLDSKGNIYEAKLQKIGSINDKKKAVIQ